MGRLSQALRLISELKPGFKLDDNLDFNLGKTMFLTQGTTGRHVYDRTQVFLQNDPNLQNTTQDFTLNMFYVQGIDVLGTPIGTDTNIKEYVTQNCIKITRDVEKHDHLIDGFVHDQLIKFCMLF